MIALESNIPSRLRILHSTLVLGLITCVLLSFRMWFGNRDFPRMPLVTWYDLTPLHEQLLSTSMLLLLVASMFMRAGRWFLAGAIAVMVIMVCGDVNRLQPWLYLFAGALCVFLMYDGRVDNSIKFTTFFSMLQLMVISAYLFTGLYQLRSFTEEEFSTIAKPLNAILSERQFAAMVHVAPLIPYAICTIAILLFIPPARYLGITLSIAMHCVLFIFLWPRGEQLNYGIWFSNLVFIPLVMILFSGRIESRHYSRSYFLKMPLQASVLAAFLFVPVYSLYQHSDLPVNSFYSTNLTRTHISKEQFRTLTSYRKAFCEADGDGYQFNFGQWCRHDLHAECLRNPLPMLISNAPAQTLVVKENELPLETADELLSVLYLQKIKQ